METDELMNTPRDRRVDSHDLNPKGGLKKRGNARGEVGGSHVRVKEG